MNADQWGNTRRGELGRQRPAGGPRPVGRGGGGRPDEDPTTEIPPSRPEGPRASAPTPRPAGSTLAGAGRRWGLLAGYVVLGIVSALVLSLTGYAWTTYHSLDSGIYKSSMALSGVKASTNGDTNILVMGLDSRLDENGHALPANIYDALHAGNQADGGMNSNVLMLLHVPGDGSKATAISIPRDDYVALPGCPDGQCHGKIKQAYGLAYDQAAKKLANQGVPDSAGRQQQQRDAGRQAEIATVQQFLGGVPIDHFIEVTLVAFFQIAQVVQPITVCVLATTHDTYSGANFQAGRQPINASQALAYVRQRRDNVRGDVYYNLFTDLDRERRQQAFIAALAYQLKQAGTFTDPGKISAILNVAKQNTAVDSSMDLLSFAQQASNLTSGNITFYTLPIDHFGKDPLGEDVNIVNLPLIQSTVHSLVTGGKAATSSAAPTTTTPPPATASGPPAVVNVVNASGRTGLAGRLETAVAGKGFTQGTASTQRTIRTSSVIEYGSGAGSAANSLAGMLGGGVTTMQVSTVGANTLKVVLGTDFTMPASLGGSAAAATSTPPPASAVQATGGAAGSAGPPPSALSALSGGGVPCVK